MMSVEVVHFVDPKRRCCGGDVVLGLQSVGGDRGEILKF